MPTNTITANPNGLPTLEQLLQRNKTYAESAHTVPPKLPDMMAAAPNTTSVFIITCLDPRCDPDNFLQPVQRGDYLALRCVGGRVGGNITGLVALDSLLKFKTVLVIHHTDCGMTYATDGAIRESLKDSVSQNELDTLTLPAYSQSDSEQTIQNDVQLLRESPLIREELRSNIHGLVYHLEDGKLAHVC